MTCTDFLAQMTDYFDGEVEPQLLLEINAHLCECHHCEILVDTTRRTIQIYRDHQVFELSEQVRERTVTNIMTACASQNSAPNK